MSRRSQHVYKDSVSAAYSDDVDSAGTTLQGTPQSESADWDAKLSGIEGSSLAGLRKNAGANGPGNSIDDLHDPDDYDYELNDLRDDSRLLPGSIETPAGPEPLNIRPRKPSDAREKPVSWSQLPRKDQLLILVIARLSEPLTQTGLQSYMFYQLKSFTLPSGETPSDGAVARQAGLITAAFTGAQFCTAIIWGRLADSERMGRKRVVLVGLIGTAVMSLGFGFSQSFAQVMFWRCLGGLLNGNIGVLKTLVAEVVREKRFQSRAFLLLPMCFNIGVIIGPLLGGLLADPVGTYPAVFGPGGSLGGSEGVGWMTKYPYALPNVVSAIFLLISTLAVVFGLEETLPGLRHRQDFGIRLRKWLVRTLLRRGPGPVYTTVSELQGLAPNSDIELQADGSHGKKKEIPKIRRKLPFRRIWTRNVLFMLLSHALMAGHIATFNTLWFVFLSTPRYDPDHVPGEYKAISANPSNTTQPLPLQKVPPNYTPHPPFTFTGGLALPPASVGTALATLGTIGILLQLTLYPRVSFLLGPLRSLRIFLCFFPIAYALAPFLAILPSSTPPPAPASGIILWLGIAAVLSVLMLARTFALPSSTILVNNSSPHPSVLGTVHGIAQSVGSATKTVGPALGGWIYSFGLNSGVVGLAWWFIAGVGVLGALAGQFVWEGDGHEIWLEGEREEVEREREMEEEDRRGDARR